MQPDFILSSKRHLQFWNCCYTFWNLKWKGVLNDDGEICSRALSKSSCLLPHTLRWVTTFADLVKVLDAPNRWYKNSLIDQGEMFLFKCLWDDYIHAWHRNLSFFWLCIVLCIYGIVVEVSGTTHPPVTTLYGHGPHDSREMRVWVAVRPAKVLRGRGLCVWQCLWRH